MGWELLLTTPAPRAEADRAKRETLFTRWSPFGVPWRNVSLFELAPPVAWLFNRLAF